MKKIVVAVTMSLVLVACTSDPYTGQQRVSKTVIGAGTGAALGALGGLIVGNSTKANKRSAILIGAGVGALAGGGIGLYMDNQEAKLREQLRGSGVSVTRVGDNIKLNMPSNVTFATDQSNVRPEFFNVLSSVGLVLKEYNRTIVNVFGHTDSEGSDSYNLDLSERRAVSVARNLINQGTDQRRYYVAGFGEEQPIASNATSSGRAANRRVEIEIAPLRDS